MERVIYSGSFDPFTNGHHDIAQRASALCSELIILVLGNRDKTSMFSFAQRVDMIKESVKDIDNIVVDSWTGLLADYCQANNITAIVRGIRGEIDFSYERDMAMLNKTLFPGLETIFIPANPQHAHISSSMVKIIASYGGDIDQLVPAHIAAALKMKQKDN